MSGSILRQALERFNAKDIAATERLCREVLQHTPDDADALHLLGVVRLIRGDPRGAASFISRALDTRPHDTVMLENLGVAYLASPEPARAEALFLKARALGASHASLYMRLGLAHGAQGKLGEAVSALRTAHNLSPGDADIHLNLCNALAEYGRTEEALDCYRKLLASQPDHAAAHYNLGNLYRSAGRLEEAVASFRQALAIASNDPDTHNNLGLVYEQQGRLDDAVLSFQQALSLNADHVQARNNLGNVLRAQGRLQEAMTCYEHALAIWPDHADAYINLGTVRTEQGRYSEALDLFERALRLNPQNVEAHYNIGSLLKLQGRAADSIAHYRRALDLGGVSRATVHNALGSAYRQTGDLRSAVACYRKAIEVDPSSATAYFYLGETLKLQGSLKESIELYKKSLERKPDDPQALNGLVHTTQHACNWECLPERWEQLRGAIANAADGQVSPFSIMSLSTSPAEQLACAVGWARKHVEPFTAARSELGFDFLTRKRGKKLRIGYLSWGFHRHATSYWIAELLELHDRNNHEVFAYDYGPDDQSEIRARIRSACDRFVDISSDFHTAAARRIYQDQIDILVDLTGYTLGARPQIIGLRPAPVQVNWFYPGTMGTESMDYFIADAFVVPAGWERFYVEEIVRLPGCYMMTDRKREVASAVPTREEHGLPESGIVFCCFNQPYKILPDMFDVWMRILRALPGSVLWLAKGSQWQTENLCREAAARGVTAERLIFAARRPLGEYMTQYRLADLALDTFPYTSHTTASDALWMGCPLVTCAGETFASRVAGSVLTSAGLGDLVTTSFEQYERLVLDLATSADKLAEVRRRLQEGRDTCPLFETSRFARNLENAYAEMFDAFLRRQPR